MKMRKLFGLAAASQILVASSAHAAGFALREFSASAMGASYAGAAATDNDPSFIFYNPASVGGVDAYDASVNLTGLILGSNANFRGTTAAGTPAGGSGSPQGFISDALVPAAALRYRLTDQLAVGLSLNTPWGESTKYPAGWEGRYYALSTSLTAYNATSMVSYQILPSLTLGAGAQIQYVHSHLSEAIDFGTLGALNGIPGSIPGKQDGYADLHGSGWGEGYILGAMWKPAPALSLGVSYRSEVRQELKGSEQFIYDAYGVAGTINALTGAFADAGGRTGVPTPAVATAGARWTIDDRWTALAGVEFTNWSSFRQLLIQSTDPVNPPAVTELNWRNTWFGSLGAEYRLDDRWTLRAGTAIDEAAAPSQTLEPRIPDANRYWISAGAGYRWTDTMDVNFGISHLFTPQATIDQSALQLGNALRGSLQGTSSSNATLIALELTIR
jgi:long-chain fatty acid transport protein